MVLITNKNKTPFNALTGFSFSKAIAILTISAFVLTALQEWSPLDIWLADFYYNAALQQFPWKNTWFAATLMHVYVKNCIVLIGILWLSITIIDLIYPLPFLNFALRMRLRFVAIAAMIIPALISALKHQSILHCPWEIQRYGGNAPYLRLFDSIAPAMQAGHCFPAGHASTALWLAALCVFCLPQRPKIAWLVFLAGLAIGFVLGWVQQMRGAHFLSHTLWSLWIAAAIILIMLKFFTTTIKPA